MYSSNVLSGKLSTSIREDRSMRSVDQSRGASTFPPEVDSDRYDVHRGATRIRVNKPHHKRLHDTCQCTEARTSRIGTIKLITARGICFLSLRARKMFIIEWNTIFSGIITSPGAPTRVSQWGTGSKWNVWRGVDLEHPRRNSAERWLWKRDRSCGQIGDTSRTYPRTRHLFTCIYMYVRGTGGGQGRGAI